VVVPVIPWQDNDCPHRAAALDHVKRHLADCHDGYAVGVLPPGEPWSKGAAIARVRYMAPQAALVIYDADVVVAPDALDAAVEAVTSKRARWAVPHLAVRRLDLDATAAVLAGEPPSRRMRLERIAYRGVDAGGVVVVDPELYAEAPFDPRLTGWGHEDLSAAHAWRCLAGAPWRGRADLFHLHHPPQAKLSRGVGSRANKLLHDRYAAAARDSVAMRSLIAEHSLRTLPTMNDVTEATV
jgi:hypothetical protein